MTKQGNFFLKHSSIILGIYFIITLVLYFPTIGAGFTTDVTSGIERLSNRPFMDVFISFGFPALNQLSVFLFYVLYKLFGINGWAWYLVYSLLHAANAFLLFKISLKLLETYQIKSPISIAIFGSLLFLISPYQSEVLVWRACQNYLLVVFFIFSCLWHVFRFLEDAQRKHLRSVYIFFLLALFTFELSLLTPFIILFLIASQYFLVSKKPNLVIGIQQIVLPQLIALGAYFCLHRLIFGKWIGHYGTKVHLVFPLENMLANTQKFFIKYLGFIRFFSHDVKSKIFNFIDQYVVYISVFSVVILVILLLYGLQKKNQTLGLILTKLGLFLLALLPILNLYFYYLQYLENDRHAYFSSAFFFILLAIILFQLPRLIRYVLASSYVLISLILLFQINGLWQNSTKVFNNLLDNFKWQETANVLILNIPDNYQGLYMFRIIGKGSGFKDALKYVKGKNIKGNFTEVAQYNMVNIGDGVKVEQLSNTRLKVTFNQWGNWFWRNGIGANNYENDLYKVTFKGHWYEIEFKEIPPDLVILYQIGTEWKVFDYKKL